MAKNLIGNSWVDASDGKTIDVLNPATKTLIDTVPDTTKEDCDNAVKAAIEGQKQWSKKSITERADILMKFAALVEKNKDELAKLLSDETGKPIAEAIGEIANVQIAMPAFCERAKHEYGLVIPKGTEKGQEGTIQYTQQYPLGVVVAVIPFNFPKTFKVLKNCFILQEFCGNNQTSLFCIQFSSNIFNYFFIIQITISFYLQCLI